MHSHLVFFKIFVPHITYYEWLCGANLGTWTDTVSLRRLIPWWLKKSCPVSTVNTPASAQMKRETSTRPCSMTSMPSTKSCTERSRLWPRSLERWMRWCRTFLSDLQAKWYETLPNTNADLDMKTLKCGTMKCVYKLCRLFFRRRNESITLWWSIRRKNL